MSLEAVRCAGQKYGAKSGENLLSDAPLRLGSSVEIWPGKRAIAGFFEDASDHAAALALIGR